MSAKTKGSNEVVAYAWAGGVIEFGASVPGGALPIAKGEAVKLRNAIQGQARHGYDNKTLLVPGIPEATTEEAALDALIDFQKRVREDLEGQAAA
jgi:hypothetical protein